MPGENEGGSLGDPTKAVVLRNYLPPAFWSEVRVKLDLTPRQTLAALYLWDHRDVPWGPSFDAGFEDFIGDDLADEDFPVINEAMAAMSELE